MRTQVDHNAMTLLVACFAQQLLLRVGVAITVRTTPDLLAATYRTNGLRIFFVTRSQLQKMLTLSRSLRADFDKTYLRAAFVTDSQIWCPGQRGIGILVVIAFDIRKG